MLGLVEIHLLRPCEDGQSLEDHDAECSLVKKNLAEPVLSLFDTLLLGWRFMFRPLFLKPRAL
jgi:hypothetical protein